jgi:hypothetical protein
MTVAEIRRQGNNRSVLLPLTGACRASRTQALRTPRRTAKFSAAL